MERKNTRFNQNFKNVEEIKEKVETLQTTVYIGFGLLLIILIYLCFKK